MTLVCFLASFLPFLLASWKFAAQFSNFCNSINFEARINSNTTRQNDLKWRNACTGLKFDLEHFNGPQTKFIGDSSQKHPVHYFLDKSITMGQNIN